MATIRYGSGTVEVPDNDPRIMAYKALNVAVGRICQSAYKRDLAANKGKPLKQFTPPAEARALVDTMPRVLIGEVSPESAMGMLWDYDVMKARLSN